MRRSLVFLLVAVVSLSALALWLDNSTVAVRGVVSDEETGAVLAGVLVSSGGQEVRSDASGNFLLPAVKRGGVLRFEALGYFPVELTVEAFSIIRPVIGSIDQVVTLRPNLVTGTVTDVETGSPLAGAKVEADGLSVVADDAGHFQLKRVKGGARLVFGAPGYRTAQVPWQGGNPVNVSLRPNVVSGTVRDLYTNRPLAGVTVTAGAKVVQTDEGGRYVLSRLELGEVLAFQLAEYAGWELTYRGEPVLDVSLRSNVVRGLVQDATDGRPLPGVTVSIGPAYTVTMADGSFTLKEAPAGSPLIIRAPGYAVQRLDLNAVTNLNVKLEPFVVKGLYIPFWLLSNPGYVKNLVASLERTELNAIVVDVKGDEGNIAYPSSQPLAQKINAQARGLMSLEEFMRWTKPRGIYTVARIVAFKDNLLAKARPDLAVKDKRNNDYWVDWGGQYWVDPFRKEVVDYNAGIAEEMARLGFDEVQYDYVRFPSDGAVSNCVYAQESTPASRMAAVDSFLANVQARLRPYGVFLAADTFGWTLFRDDDLGIGQRIENMGRHLDYLSPMVYPSTWRPGARGLDYPPAYPYEIVFQSVQYGIGRLKGLPAIKVRPWLQHFDDYQKRRLPYGPAEFELQRKAAVEAGGLGWMWWNAGGVYQMSAFAPRGER
ncbi:MAG: putative glycoside hydrolase [Chloroflexota bacterium]